MKKRCIFLLLLVFVVLSLSAFTPLDGWWLDVKTSQLGDIRIYINSSYSSYFTIDEDEKPILMYNSTVNGYTLTSSGIRQYAITIGSYGEPWYYRSYNSSSQYNQPLTIQAVDFDTSTIQFMGRNIDDQKMIYYLMLFFACALLLGVWRCARK